MEADRSDKREKLVERESQGLANFNYRIFANINGASNN